MLAYNDIFAIYHPKKRNVNSMDFKPLIHFLALSESLHFGRASDACHISPSTLSRTIKQLEEQLGVVLFERDNRRVALTREGQHLQRYARETLQQWNILKNELMKKSGELQGELSMYCSVTASYSFLYDILNEFRPRYPKIEIKLHTGDPELAIQHVISEQEDFSIAAKPESLPAGLAFKPIATSPLVFIAPANDSKLTESLQLPLTNDQWSSIPMILSERGVARKRLDQWFKDRKVKPNIYAQVAGNEAIVSMVSLGFGIGVVPAIVLNNSPLADNIRLLDISPQLKAFDVGLCVLEKKLKNPLIAAFWAQPFKAATQTMN